MVPPHCLSRSSLVPYRILHVSDLHVGPPFCKPIAEALVRQAHALRPDLLVISGDFVQRADFPSQWEAARALRAALPGPQLVVPGNHDVPLFNLYLRLFAPLALYRQMISRDLNPVFTLPGLVVVGAVTAHGLTLDGGKVSQAQAAALRTILGRYGPDTCKIVVWHHPVMNPPGPYRDRVIEAAPAAIRLLDACNVELLLCGHLHVTFIGNTRNVVHDLHQGTIICQSGTTTSRRGHGPEQGKHSCNLIEVDAQAIKISSLLYQAASDRFESTAEYVFPRRTGEF